MYPANQIVTKLETEKRWLQKQVGVYSRPHDPATYRKNDIISSCVSVLSDSIQGYTGWAERRGRRKLLLAPDWYRAGKIRVLCQLIDLCISDLLACNAFRKTRRCGPLNVSRISDRQRIAARKSLKRARDVQLQQRQELNSIREVAYE